MPLDDAKPIRDPRLYEVADIAGKPIAGVDYPPFLADDDPDAKLARELRDNCIMIMSGVMAAVSGKPTEEEIGYWELDQNQMRRETLARIYGKERKSTSGIVEYFGMMMIDTFWVGFLIGCKATIKMVENDQKAKGPYPYLYFRADSDMMEVFADFLGYGDSFMNNASNDNLSQAAATVRAHIKEGNPVVQFTREVARDVLLHIWPRGDDMAMPPLPFFDDPLFTQILNWESSDEKKAAKTKRR